MISLYYKKSEYKKIWEDIQNDNHFRKQTIHILKRIEYAIAIFRPCKYI